MPLWKRLSDHISMAKFERANGTDTRKLYQFLKNVKRENVKIQELHVGKYDHLSGLQKEEQKWIKKLHPTLNQIASFKL